MKDTYGRISLPKRFTRTVMAAASLQGQKPIDYTEQVLVEAALNVLKHGPNDKRFFVPQRAKKEPNLALMLTKESHDLIKTACKIEGLSPPQFVWKYLIPKALSDAEKSLAQLKQLFDAA